MQPWHSQNYLICIFFLCYIWLSSSAVKWAKLVDSLKTCPTFVLSRNSRRFSTCWEFVPGPSSAPAFITLGTAWSFLVLCLQTFLQILQKYKYKYYKYKYKYKESNNRLLVESRFSKDKVGLRTDSSGVGKADKILWEFCSNNTTATAVFCLGIFDLIWRSFGWW